VTRPVTVAWVALAHLVGLGALVLASVISPDSPPKPLRVQLAATFNTPKGDQAPRSMTSRESSVSPTLQKPVVASQPDLNQSPLSSNRTPPPLPAPPPVVSQATPQAVPKIVPQTGAQLSGSPMPAANSASSPAVASSHLKPSFDGTRTPNRVDTAGGAGTKADSPPLVDASFAGNRPPEYPAMSRRTGEQGVVALRVMIGTDGRASDVVVTRSSGSPRLDQAAITAIRQWRFVPAQQGGRPVSQWYDWRWEFRLKD
jgi:periplasmic protein TonB